MTYPRTKTLTVTLAAFTLSGLTLGACLAPPCEGAACGSEPAEATERQGDELAWASNDDPAKFDFDKDFQYKLSDLPTEGEADVAPWPGSYWPTYRDSINFRWDGSVGNTPGSALSPAEKFAQAFERPLLVDAVSAQFGIDSRPTQCETKSDCEETEVCSKRLGETEGRCVETWFGICHAWAPAAIMVPEPKHDVTYKGVTFKVSDIKALVSLAYTHGLSTRFLSGRCNDKGEDITYDQYGRPENAACMNTNPGTFHVVATNMLGIKKQTFVEDKTFDYQVWNQPVRGFKVLKNAAITAAEANALITASGSAYLFNDDAVSFRHMKTKLSYIFEPAQNVDGNLASAIDSYTANDYYEYVLELDADGKIIGGEWLGSSKKNHPDFLWSPRLKYWTEVAKTNNQAGTGIKWHEVVYLVNESIKEAGEPSGPSTGGFDWGDACDSGNGAFEQDIKHYDVVEVGTIPKGKANVYISLVSPTDVDIQLYDKSTNTALVAWPSGTLNGPGEQTLQYEGMTIKYSGYNGVNGDWGDEYIEVKGTISKNLTMKAFGYKAGQASVTYSYEAASPCIDAGVGAFSQEIKLYDVVDVGVIPAKKTNIRIQLDSLVDVDVQLYDGPVALVRWPDGMMSGYNKQTINYEGMVIEWSGYNGDGTHYGNEYITIKGEVPSDLTMRAFGYKSGDADVKYAWGLTDGELANSL